MSQPGMYRARHARFYIVLAVCSNSRLLVARLLRQVFYMEISMVWGGSCVA
jgi:hypothetical protein